MLNVVIGLIFILLLFSLLATTIMELIAGFFALRGRNLEKAIRNMLAGDGQDNIYDSFLSNPLYTQYTRRLSGKERPPSYLSSKAFSSILLDVLFREKKADRMDEQITKLENEDLKFILRHMHEEAGQDPVIFRGNVEKWYDDVMDRASGWYKRNTQRLLLFVGLFIAVVFNADTIAIYDKLARSPETRLQIANMAREQIAVSESVGISTAEMVNGIDVKSNLNKLIADDIATLNNPLGLGWDSFVAPATEKRNYFWLEKIFGWLITALAVSLGAPFWFDLLRKVVNVRSSGNVPVSTNHPQVPVTTVPQVVPDNLNTTKTYAKGVKPGEAVG